MALDQKELKKDEVHTPKQRVQKEVGLEELQWGAGVGLRGLGCMRHLHLPGLLIPSVNYKGPFLKLKGGWGGRRAKMAG